MDNLGDSLYFRARDEIEELVVELHPDLLHTTESFPAVFDDVVQVAPAFVVEEFAGGGGSYAPDFVEQTQDLQVLVCFDVFGGFDGARIRPLDVEIGDFGVAAWQVENLTRVADFVWVCCQSCDTGAVGSDADFVVCEQAGEFDLLEQGDKGFVWGICGSKALTGILSACFDSLGHFGEVAGDAGCVFGCGLLEEVGVLLALGSCFPAGGSAG